MKDFANREESSLRHRLFEIIEKAGPGDKASRRYDIFIVIVAVFSLVPLMFKTQDWFGALYWIDLISVYILFADYIAHWITYDFKCGITGWRAFVRYPFTLVAIIDLAAILPSLGLLPTQFMFLRVLRVFKLFRYSHSLVIVANVFRAEKDTLLSVLAIAIGYIFISALAMFTYEPDTFDNFFEALYWATTALTTVGYGDVYPVSDAGRLISMISSLFGIAVIALPAGIVTGGFLEEIRKSNADPEEYFEESDQVEGEAAQTNLVAPTSYIKRHPRTMRYVCVMAICCIINTVLYEVSSALDLPLWLDTTGTALAAFALGPAPGVLVALVNNLYLSLFHYGPSSLIYFTTSALVAIVYGSLLAKLKNRGARSFSGTVKTILLAVVLLTVGISLLDVIYAYWLKGGMVVDPEELAIVRLFMAQSIPTVVALFCGILLVRILDSTAVAACVFLIWLIIPRRFKTIDYIPPHKEEVDQGSGDSLP